MSDLDILNLRIVIKVCLAGLDSILDTTHIIRTFDKLRNRFMETETSEIRTPLALVLFLFMYDSRAHGTWS